MRNGLLRAALAAALLMVVPAPAVAADPGLTISLPPTSDGILEIPYTSTVGGDLITVDLREPGAADFVRSMRDVVRPSGTLRAFFYQQPARVIEGKWGVRVTVWSGGQELARAEGATQLAWQASIAVAAPYFGEVPVGMPSGIAKLRIENFSWGPLRIRSVRAPTGSELTIIEDGCSGQTLYGLQGCYMSLTFTPTAVGQRRGTLLVDANAATKEVYTLGVGIPAAPEPPLALVPTPAPAPAPEPVIEAPPEPELTFGSMPGRKTTRLFGLRIDDVPAGSTVTVRCAGTCPTKTYTKRSASGTVSLQRFARRALKAGTRLRVTLAAPGRPARTVTVTVRARRTPRVTGSFAV